MFPSALRDILIFVASLRVSPLAPVLLCRSEPAKSTMFIYYATGNKWKAFGWSLLSGVTEPIGGILGFAALQPVFTDLVFGMIFSMVGGMMIFIVLHELLPAAHRYT